VKENNGNNILDTPKGQDLQLDFTSFQLVSLFDLMNKFNIGFFYTVAKSFERLATVKNPDVITELDEETKKPYVGILNMIITSCEEVELNLSVLLAKYLKDGVEKGSIKSFNELAAKLPNLQDRIRDELSLSLFMQIPYNKASFYKDNNLFGNKVFNNFSSAAFDIEEAGKCFATARYTACVMHLQRALEVALKGYGTFLSIFSLAKSAQPSWNRVLDETRKEIKERNEKKITNKVWASNKEKEFCEGVQPFLESVKIAWRNPSMHADKKYTEEIAEDIFSTVKRFMKHLAEHLDESGKFMP
jgi:HEPN domain-containing protein